MALQSHGEDAFSNVLKLNFRDHVLYGRSKEMNTLMETADRVCNNHQNEIVLVYGYSGTGKSTLIQKSLSHKQKLFASGKFQQLQGTTEPFADVVSAFDELCHAILTSEQDSSQEVITNIRNAMNCEQVAVLTKIVPRAKEILLEKTSEQHLGTDSAGIGKTEALNQLKFAFRAFVRAICSNSNIRHVDPMVLCLDDLQWADVASLDLIKSIVTDPESKRFLFVGSYRDNEVSKHLEDWIHHVENAFERCIVRIQLVNLTKTNVNQLVSDVTKLDLDETMPLSDIVYNKTHGNVFFVIQFLRYLHQKQFLHYSFSTYKWTWDMDRIQSETNVSDNVVELVVSKIQCLPQNVQSAIMVASCLASTFNVNLLTLILSQMDICNTHVENDLDVIQLLNQAATEGLVEQRKRHDSTKYYKFSHDRIQQAAYSLLPQGKGRELFHLQIGQQIWQLLKQQQDSEGDMSNEWLCFVAADQLNRGSNHLEDSQERVELAKLNLTAGLNAIHMSAFYPAAEYLESGMAVLLDKQKWQREHYDLCLELTSVAAEVAYVNGDFVKNQLLVDQVMSHAHCARDKLRAQTSLVDSLSSQQRLQDAIDLGLLMLKELGERFPKKVTTLHVLAGMIKTNRLLKGLSDHDILSLDQMKDENKLTIVKLLIPISRFAGFLQKGEVMVFIILRLVCLTIRHGLSEYSGQVFAVFGIVQSGGLGDIQAGYRFGRLASMLIDKFHAKTWEATVSAVRGNFVDHWILPLQDCLDSLLRGHKIGMENGLVELAMMCSGGYVHSYFAAGLPLGPWESDAKYFCRQMLELNQHSAFYFHAPFWQLALNLMGKSENPLVLTGEAFDQDEFLRTLQERSNRMALQSIWLVRAQLGYYFDDLEMAVNMIETFRKNSENMKGHIYYYMYSFFLGMICLERYRRSTKRKYRVRAKKTIDAFKKWASHGGVNCVHKLQLLEADYAALVRKESTEKIKKRFDAAISSASRAGFLQDAALANERAGLFFSRGVDEFWASSYLSRSHELYVEWGAVGKAEHLKNQLAGSALLTAQSKFSTGHKARSRFDDVSATTKSKKRMLDDLS